MKRKYAFQFIESTHVPCWVRDYCAVFSNWLEERFTIPHKIVTLVVPVAAFQDYDRVKYLGFFSPTVLGRPWIGLACRQRVGRSRNPRIRHGRRIHALLHTFAHEFAHYEKWRDKKVNNHRGIPQRTDRLVREFTKYAETL